MGGGGFAQAAENIEKDAQSHATLRACAAPRNG